MRLLGCVSFRAAVYLGFSRETAEEFRKIPYSALLLLAFPVGLVVFVKMGIEINAQKLRESRTKRSAAKMNMANLNQWKQKSKNG